MMSKSTYTLKCFITYISPKDNMLPNHSVCIRNSQNMKSPLLLNRISVMLGSEE